MNAKNCGIAVVECARDLGWYFLISGSVSEISLSVLPYFYSTLDSDAQGVLSLQICDQPFNRFGL